MTTSGLSNSASCSQAMGRLRARRAGSARLVVPGMTADSFNSVSRRWWRRRRARLLE
jgi:hypothetical protein